MRFMRWLVREGCLWISTKCAATLEHVWQQRQGNEVLQQTAVDTVVSASDDTEDKSSLYLEWIRQDTLKGFAANRVPATDLLTFPTAWRKLFRSEQSSSDWPTDIPNSLTEIVIITLHVTKYSNSCMGMAHIISLLLTTGGRRRRREWGGEEKGVKEFLHVWQCSGAAWLSARWTTAKRMWMWSRQLLY